MSNALAKVEDLSVSRPQEQNLNLGAIAEKILSGELTPEKLTMIKDLVAMDAQRKFAAAFADLQREMPKIQANKAVPNRDGSVRYTYAPFEEIMNQLAPLLSAHGFSVSFSTRYDPPRLIAICQILHSGGHEKNFEFAARVGSGPPAASEAQADGAASTYAKRYALCQAFNIVIRGMDNDARAEGGTITQQQAMDLEQRVKDTKSDVKAFLKLAGATSFDEIREDKYEMLHSMLLKKESRR